MVIKIVATIVAMLCIVIFGCFLICDKDGYFDAKKIIVNYSNIFSKSKLKVRMIYAVLLILSVSIGIVETINSDLIESVTLIVSVLSGVFLAFLPVVMDLKNKDIDIRVYNRNTIKNNINFESYDIDKACRYLENIYTSLLDEMEE